MPVPIRPLPPTDRDAPILCRKRSVLGRICGKLMDYHRHDLSRLRSQKDFRAVDVSVAILRVGCELALD